MTEERLYQLQATTGACLHAHKEPGRPWVIRMKGEYEVWDVDRLCLQPLHIVYEGTGDTISEAMRDLLDKIPAGVYPGRQVSGG